MMGKVATSRKARVISNIEKPKLFPPSQSKVLSTKKRDDICLANIAAPVVRGLYCPCYQKLAKKVLHEITVTSQG